MSEDARLRHWLLSKGRVIACAAVSGSVAGYWFIRATPGWPTDSTVLRILCPDPLLRPLVVTLPAIHISHEWFTARYGKKSSVVCAHTAFGLGIAAACSIAILRRDWIAKFVWKDSGNLSYGVFLGLLVTYHLAEFASVATYNPNILSDDSFLTNERSFCLAMLLSMVEHYLELSFIPSIKGWAPVCALGAAGMIFGEFFRKGALYCAKHNFTHQIEDRNKRKEHRLVTTGVYSFSRHPGYFGWFWWSISTQVLLCNPISTMLFARISWQFFHDRIPYEELHLERFFGKDYVNYRQRVPTRIPFIP